MNDVNIRRKLNCFFCLIAWWWNSRLAIICTSSIKILIINQSGFFLVIFSSTQRISIGSLIPCLPLTLNCSWCSKGSYLCRIRFKIVPFHRPSGRTSLIQIEVMSFLFFVILLVLNLKDGRLLRILVLWPFARSPSTAVRSASVWCKPRQMVKWGPPIAAAVVHHAG